MKFAIYNKKTLRIIQEYDQMSLAQMHLQSLNRYLRGQWGLKEMKDEL
jgi:enoyl-[acyl-carrier-protein] reductase (NADH)